MLIRFYTYMYIILAINLRRRKKHIRQSGLDILSIVSDDNDKNKTRIKKSIYIYESKNNELWLNNVRNDPQSTYVSYRIVLQPDPRTKRMSRHSAKDDFMCVFFYLIFFFLCHKINI